MVLLYDSLPTRPIGQLALPASKGKFTNDLTFQVINTDQPALLSTEASKTLDALTLRADFIRKCPTSDPPQPLTTEPDSHQVSAAPPTPRYVNASLAYTRDLNSGIYFQELDITLSRSGLPRPTRRF